MNGWKTWIGLVAFGVLLVTAPVWAVDAAVDAAVLAALPRVGAVIARSASFDGSSLEETGNCLLWTVGDKTYTLGDLHTVMTGEEGASEWVADQILVRVGKRSSRAKLVWPREGQRNVREVDIAILELTEGLVGQPFGPDAFEGSATTLPGELFLAAPGHRSKILPLEARTVGYASQWFIYRELSHGDSGGMVFGLQDGRVVPYGFVSSIGSLPGESARGTVMYGRAAMRTFIGQFLAARAGTSLVEQRAATR